MRCPKCGYVRKPEDLAPEWQCPACQVIYAKASQENTYSRMIGASVPSYASKPKSSGAPITFKIVCITLITALAAFFLWPAQPGSKLFAARSQVAGQCKSIQNSVGLSLKSEQEKKELLACKKEELKAYEDVLQQVEADIARMQSEVGTCAITGQPNKFVLNQDPRPELQTKIDKVKEEIRQLENKS